MSNMEAKKKAQQMNRLKILLLVDLNVVMVLMTRKKDLGNTTGGKYSY